jgi:hypothetical protein
MRQVARANAEHEPAPAQEIDHRVSLGNAPRVVKGKDGDGGAYPDAGGPLGNGGEHDRGIRDHAVLMEVMLGAEKGVVAQPFGHFALVQYLVIQLRHGARPAGVMVVDREERQAQGGGGHLRVS